MLPFSESIFFTHYYTIGGASSLSILKSALVPLVNALLSPIIAFAISV